MARVEVSNMCPGLAGALARPKNSEESGARMYMRADVEIFLKGTAGQDAEGDGSEERMREIRKVLGKGCTPPTRAVPLRGTVENDGELDR